jgi:antitoxin HigA-1
MLTAPTSSTPYKTIDERTDVPPLHPGEVLREDLLPHLGLTAHDLAIRLTLPQHTIDAILDERLALTHELAARLGEFSGLGTHYWQALQLQVDLWHGLVMPPISGWRHTAFV